MSGRRGHGGGDGDGDGDSHSPGPGGDDNGNTVDGRGGDAGDPCVGYDPLPEVVVARIEGTYSLDGMDSSEVTGEVVMTLSPAEFEYAIEATVEIHDSRAGLVVSCEDGVGNAACYGGLSVTLCEGDGYFSYDLSSSSGSWSYYDSATSAYGSGSVLGTDS